MKIHRAVVCSERLPKEEGMYHVIDSNEFESIKYFNGERFEVDTFTTIDYWLEIIDITLREFIEIYKDNIQKDLSECNKELNIDINKLVNENFSDLLLSKKIKDVTDTQRLDWLETTLQDSTTNFLYDYRDNQFKKFRAPIKFDIQCKHCGANITIDLEKDYLMYPPLGEWFFEEVTCNVCDNETEYELKLSIKAEIKQNKEFEGSTIILST